MPHRLAVFDAPLGGVCERPPTSPRGRYDDGIPERPPTRLDRVECRAEALMLRHEGEDWRFLGKHRAGAAAFRRWLAETGA